MRNFALLLIALFTSVCKLYSQDIIVMKSGNRLNAKIFHEDSIKVDFTFDSKGHVVTSYANRSDIESIQYGTKKGKSVVSRNENTDRIVQKNGVIIPCRILSEDNTHVIYSVTKNGTSVTTSIDMSEVDHVLYGDVNNSTEGPMNEKSALGFGLGRDYGGVGLNVTGYLSPNVGLFGGLGYALVDIGLNGGLKLKLNSSESTNLVVPFLMGMYGYNTAVKIINAPQHNKLFYNLTFGIGMDIHMRNVRGFWCISLLIPVVGNDVNEYITKLKNSYGVQFNNGIPKAGFSLGYRISSY